MKKLVWHSEAVYITAVVMLAFAVAMLTAANFGVSMIVAPAYLLSLRVSFLSFGQAEYVIQAMLFVVLCLVLRRFRVVYLFSFFTGLFYGAVLDLWRLLPCFDPQVTPPGSMALWLRIVMFVGGVLLTSLSVALFYTTYLNPQVYDFFVKAVSGKYGIKTVRFKTCFDLSFLLIAAVMTFAFFGKPVGVSFGTLLMAVCNGTIIGLFGKGIDRFFVIQPLFKSFAAHFVLKQEITAKT